MKPLMFLFALFAILGALDYLCGNKTGLGKEFERGVLALGTVYFSMVGMIVIAPCFSALLTPLLADYTGALDFSAIPAMLFANDMGGAQLAVAVAKDTSLGIFNGLIVASMMGCTVSFTVPFVLGTVKKELHRPILTGLLCGIVTIPIGALVGGGILGIPFPELLLNLLPLTVFSAVIAFCLFRFQNGCVRVFGIIGAVIKGIVVIGLALAIFRYLTGITPLPSAETLENASAVIINIMAVLSGAFPLIFVLSKLLRKPLRSLGRCIGVNEDSALGLLSTLATSVTTFGNAGKMDEKGLVVNSAFAVSAAFMFADHLAFTTAYYPAAVGAMLAAKASAGVTAVIVALLVWRYTKK